MAVTDAAPLYLHFAGQCVGIACRDAEAAAYLLRHFRHCAGRTAAVAAEYDMEVGADRLVSVTRNGERGYYGSLSPYLIEWLMQELTRMLAAPCDTELVVHAAGLARADAGVLICGTSGSGKSTLAAWLIGAGFDFLSDELIAIAPGATQMSGFPRPIALKVGAAFAWQSLVPPNVQHELLRVGDATVMLDPELLRADCVRTTARPACLLFPCYAPDVAFHAERLSPAAALFRLLQRTLNAGNLPDHGVPVAGQVTRRVPAYAVSYARVSDVADWLAALLAEDGDLSGGV